MPALIRRGATRKNIYVDHASGAKASRPELNGKLRDGDTLAQDLYDSGQKTVQQIADILKVPRTAIYGRINRTETAKT